MGKAVERSLPGTVLRPVLVAFIVAFAAAACGSDDTPVAFSSSTGGGPNRPSPSADAARLPDQPVDPGAGFVDRPIVPSAARDGGPQTEGGSGATVSGSVRVGSTMFLDGDVADPSDVVVPNDSLATAQAVGGTATVGGYLGLLGNGPDTNDFYSVDLANGEVVALYIALPGNATAAPDFDLNLYDSSGNVVASSTGTGRVETVVAPSSASYRIQVTSPNGDAGIYTLAVGASLSSFSLESALRDKLSPGWPMMPGEALVKLRAGIQTSADVWARLRARPLSARSNAIGFRRVALDPPAGTKALRASVAHDAMSTIAAVKRLRADPNVEFAEPNYVRQADTAPPNDPLYAVQWHYPLVSLLDAWDHSTGAGTIVAVLDCGVVKEHPDFVNANSSSQLIGGYDMIADPSISADGDGRDPDPEDPGDRALANDSSWHGTHTSGTVAAATNNATGCAGVAPNTKVMPVRVLGIGGGTTDDINQGILYAAGLVNDSGVVPPVHADVINMSLGGQGLSQSTAAAVQAARGAGLVVVAAAGNDSADASAYSPAGEPGVVTVSAIDMTKSLAWYSNFGRVVDVAAPGGDVTVDIDANGVPDGVMSLVDAAGGRKLYTPYQGTSMSAPHVSGIVALMKAAYPALTPAFFDSMIAGTAGTPPIVEDLGPAGRDDQFGYGLLNANLAVLAALEAGSNPAAPAPVLLLSPTTLDFGVSDTSMTFDVSNVGRGTLTISSFQADQPWVTITPRSVGTNTVTIDRTGLSAGVHTSTITVTSNGGTAAVGVRLTVSSSTVVTGGDIGVVYVVAVDPQTNKGVAEARADASNGYAFRIPNLPKGSYRIVAGTDFDDNGFIGDDGEAYGAYPLPSEPHVIALSGDVSGIVFPVSLQFGAQSASVGGRSGAPSERRVQRPAR